MQTANNTKAWFDDEASSEELDYPIHEYDLATTPNDFNVHTLFSLIEAGTIRIPIFQRNFVWDLKHASKLIESLIIGLPIPQLFLYEEARNRFSVIDGQQRLMSIYYFIKQRFPRVEKRTELREIFEREGNVPPDILEDDMYFSKFNLNLSTQIPNQKNKFNGLNYSTLGEYQARFELSPVRTMVIKQISPANDDSAIYEIFNRLNSGGVNLRPQEIRASLYHSEFYNMLYRLNTEKRWRRLVGIEAPDLHMKDVEFILRGFAMLVNRDQYSSAMVKFLNDFSRKARSYQQSEITYYRDLFLSFLDSSSDLSTDAFLGTTQRFSITIFESIFVAVCSGLLANKNLVEGKITPASVNQLKRDPQFVEATQRATASKSNVDTRLARAQSIIQVAR